MRRGRQNFELKLFGCKNVPYVGQINVRWWGKIFGGTKRSRGAPKSFRGAEKLQGRKKPIRKTEKIVATFFFVGGTKNSAGERRMVNMVNVTPLGGGGGGGEGVHLDFFLWNLISR